jgi:hypothetical protein
MRFSALFANHRKPHQIQVDPRQLAAPSYTVLAANEGKSRVVCGEVPGVRRWHRQNESDVACPWAGQAAAENEQTYSRRNVWRCHCQGKRRLPSLAEMTANHKTVTGIAVTPNQDFNKQFATASEKLRPKSTVKPT